MSVAAGFHAIQPSWLDRILRDGGHSTALVIGLVFEPLRFAGATTDMARLRLAYADGGDAGPATLIAKIRGLDQQRAQMDAAMGLFDREIRFYQEIAPQLPVRVPNALHIGDGRTAPLLLEDLGHLRLGDQAAGLTVADARACVDALADLHAAYWSSPTLGNNWLTRPWQGIFKDMAAQMMVTGIPGVDAIKDQVPRATASRIPEDPAVWAACIARLGEGPHTLIHNDCRLDNLFFAGDGTPVFLDWQTIADGRASQDVANLLAGSMDPEPLAGHWEELLRRYHNRLTDRGVTGYSYDEFLDHYRQNLIWPLGQGLALLGALSRGDDNRGVGAKNVIRALSHIHDMDAFSA